MENFLIMEFPEALRSLAWAVRRMLPQIALSLPTLNTSGPDTIEGLVGRLCLRNGLLYRVVDLEHAWWQSPAESMLGVRLGTERDRQVEFVVLFAHRQRYNLMRCGYEDTKIDDAAASALECYGFVLRQPIELRELHGVGIILGRLAGAKADLGLLFSLFTLAILLSMTLPKCLVLIISASASSSYSRHHLVRIVAMVGAILALLTMTIVSRQRLVSRLRARLALDGQGGLWAGVLLQDLRLFEQVGSARIAQTATVLDHLQNLIDANTLSAALDTFLGLGYLVGLSMVSMKATMAVGACYAFLCIMAIHVARSDYRQTEILLRMQEEADVLGRSLVDGVDRLRISGTTRSAHDLWSRSEAGLVDEELRMDSIRLRYRWITESFGFTTVVALLFWHTRLSNQPSDNAVLLTFLLMLTQVQSAAARSIALTPSLVTACVSWKRALDLGDRCSAPPRKGRQLGPLHSIEFESVSARYNAGTTILNAISLRAHEGEMIALVGGSGSGKSTCLRVLLGFLPLDGGSLRFNGIDASDTDMRELRKRFGVVLQTSRALAGNLFQVIGGGGNISIDDAWELARLVDLDRDIEALPMGMFTPYNSSTQTFSGGQVQRLLLARAFANQPELLLLDEATSALDNISQEHIMKYVRSQPMIKLVVAHRFSTIRQADRIYVLERGRITAEGNFAELMCSSALFRMMAEAQGCEPYSPERQGYAEK